jgi:glutamate/aspartate transport system permease protein
MNYNWNWAVLFEQSPTGEGAYFHLLLVGMRWTVATTALAAVVAVILGTVVGVLRTLESPIARALGRAYVEIFRNVPLIVQLFLWYFVLPELLPADVGRWIKQLPEAPFFAAVFGIGLYMSARVAEQVRSAIDSLPKGQPMAGMAMGFSTAQTYRYVLLPRAYRIVWPTLTTDLTNTVKATSVALTIGLSELTAQANAMQEFSFQVFEAFGAALSIYLALNMSLLFIMRKIERRIALPGFGI